MKKDRKSEVMVKSFQELKAVFDLGDADLAKKYPQNDFKTYRLQYLSKNTATHTKASNEAKTANS